MNPYTVTVLEVTVKTWTQTIDAKSEAEAKRRTIDRTEGEYSKPTTDRLTIAARIDKGN